MTQQTRIYPVSTFPGGVVNYATLRTELENEPGIATQLVNLSVEEGTPGGGNTTTAGKIRLVYAAPLGVSEANTLDGGIAVVDGTQTDPLGAATTLGKHVNTPTAVDASTTEAGVVRTQNQPQTPGLRYCDRDVLMTTGKVTTADAVEDKKVDCANNKLLDWNEVTLEGCYKKVGEDYVLCANQAEADTEAELSVFAFAPNDQQPTPAPCMIEVLGGEIVPDPTLTQGHQHLCFVVGAPNVPTSYGGQQRMFDGYLEPSAVSQNTISAIAPAAQPLDPTVNAEGGKMKFWFYYPKGTSHTHVVRLITYRQPETM